MGTEEEYIVISYNVLCNQTIYNSRHKFYLALNIFFSPRRDYVGKRTRRSSPHEHRHLCPPPDLLGWPRPLLKLCHCAVFFHTFEWQDQRPFNCISTFRHILFQGMLVHSQLRWFSVHIRSQANTELFAEQLHHGAIQQQGQNETECSLCFILLPHPCNANASCSLARAKPHLGDSSTCFPSYTRYPPGATRTSDNLDFSRLPILCPGLMCKVVPNCTSTAKAQ